MTHRALSERCREIAGIYLDPHKDLCIALFWAALYVAWIVVNMEPILCQSSVA